MAASITLLAAPGALFFSKADFEEGAAHAIATERVISAYRADGFDETLWEGMLALGYDRNDIAEVIANPSAPFHCGYGRPSKDMRGESV